MKNYVFEYLDENDYRVKERTIRKYSMLAYKKMAFDYYLKLKSGNFLGKKVNIDKENNTISYDLKIPTDEKFEKVHGEIHLFYTVYEDKGVILLTNITPEDFLKEAHRTELETYKGVLISKTDPKKDMFKVDLLNLLQK